MRRSLRLALSCAMVAGLTGGARADAIDGDWCSAGGRQMVVTGPAIVTPRGAETRGD